VYYNPCLRTDSKTGKTKASGRTPKEENLCGSQWLCVGGYPYLSELMLWVDVFRPLSLSLSLRPAIPLSLDRSSFVGVHIKTTMLSHPVIFSVEPLKSAENLDTWEKNRGTHHLRHLDPQTRLASMLLRGQSVRRHFFDYFKISWPLIGASNWVILLAFESASKGLRRGKIKRRILKYIGGREGLTTN